MGAFKIAVNLPYQGVKNSQELAISWEFPILSLSKEGMGVKKLRTKNFEL